MLLLAPRAVVRGWADGRRLAEIRRNAKTQNPCARRRGRRTRRGSHGRRAECAQRSRPHGLHGGAAGAEAHKLACQGGTLPPDVLLKDFNSRMPGMMPVDMRMRASQTSSGSLDGDDDARLPKKSRNYTCTVYGVGLLQRAGLLLKDHIELLSLHRQAEGAAGVRAAAKGTNALRVCSS